MPPDVLQPVRLILLTLALDVSTFTASRLSRPQPASDPGSESRNYVGEKWPINFAQTPDFHVTPSDLLHAVNQRHGTHGFISLPKEGALRIFFALKNPTGSAGFEPANLGTRGLYILSCVTMKFFVSFIVFIE
jgi:hypothetical protein